MSGWSETRKDMLDKKYEFIDEDAANAPAKKKPQSVKKANHKHDYKPILIDSFSKYTGKWVRNYLSYCPICGKLKDSQSDLEAQKLFPSVKVGMFGFFTMGLDADSEFDEFKVWAEGHYPLVVWKEFDYFNNKVIPLDMIN